MPISIEAAAERAMRAFELSQGRAVREWSTLPDFARQPWRAVALAVLERETRTELLAGSRRRRELELDDDSEGEA